jgi:uncharacterized protein YjdB
LSDNNTLTAATQTELIKLGVKNVYVVGAISQTVVDQLNTLSGVTATVLKGTDRIGTAAAISAKLTAPTGSFVVGYGALADALSVASYAAANNYSILVANPDGSLPASEAAYQGAKTYIIGGPTLVADIPGATRLFGTDRFATNQVVLNALTYTYNNVYVANGADAHLVDSLVASSLAADSGAPIILTNTDGVGITASRRLPANAVVTALGGNTVVPDEVVAQLADKIDVTPPVTPPVVGPVTINALTVSGQLVGSGALSSPAVALINNEVTVSTVANGASAVNASITYLVSTSNNITAKDANGNTLVATTLNSPVISGNDTFSAAYTVPADASGNVKAIFTSTASSQQAFNVVVEAPFSNNGQPVRSNEASIEWGVPGTTVLSPVYTASNPDGLNFSTEGAMKGLVPVVATILSASGSTTPVSGQPVKFTMTKTGGTSDTNAYFTDSTGITMVASGAAVGYGGSSTSVVYVVNTDANGQALVYINSNLPTTNGLGDPGAAMSVSVNAQPVNGGGSTNAGNYQWKAVAQATKIGNVSPSAMLNPTGVSVGTTLVATNAETATSGSQMTISGTLQDSAGNPVRNATVAIQDYDVVNGMSNNVQNDAYVVNGTTTLFSAVNYPVVTTDSNGNFSVVVTANVPVTQSVLDSVTQYYAYYVPPTIAVTTGQSLPTTVTPLTFVGNSNSGNFINLVWQQGQTVQSVGVSHTSLMPNYNTLSAVPQTTSFTNVVGSDELMYVAAYNQNGTIIAPASGNQFDGYALTYDITAPSGVYFDLLGSVTLPTMTTATGTYGIGEIIAHYTQTGGFVVDSATYDDPNSTSATAALLAGTNPYATAYDGSGQLNFYLQSNNTSAVISSGTAGSVNVNISAYSNSATTIDTNHAQGSAAGMINAAFTASNTIGSLGVAADATGFDQYIPLLDGNAAPGSTVTVAGVAIPGNNTYDLSRNALFVAAPFNSYPALSTIPSQGLTMNMSTSLNGVISNVDGYTLTTMPNNVTVNVNSVGEVSVNNVKLWTAQPGYKVVGYMPGSISGSVSLIEENLSTLTSFIGVQVTSSSTAGTQIATWTLPSTSLPSNFEEFLGFNVSPTGQLQPMVASYFRNNGNSFAPYSTDVSSFSTGMFNPVEVAQVCSSDKYSENPVITVSNSLNSKTATVTENFTAATGGLVAIRANPSSVNSVIGGTQNITLTAEDVYGNPISNQTIYLGVGTPGLWLTQVNGISITGSVNMGTTSSTSMQTINTPVPLFDVVDAPAYTSASVSGITAYNLNTANPVVALQTGSDGTVSITLADGNVMYVANNGSTTITNSYTVDPGISISGQTIGLYSNAALTAKLGSVLVNWGSSGHSGSSSSSKVAVTGVSLSQTALSLTAGGATNTLVATVTPTNATNQAVTWVSSNPAIATVANGVVTPISPGTVIITVTTQDGSMTATSTVTVAAKVAVTGVSLSQTALSLTAGGATNTLVATVTPTNATTQAVTWVSSNPAIATVANGVVTPISPGTAIITVTTQDGSMTATSTVTVTAKVAVTGVSLSQTALSLTAGGATNTLVATVTPTNATTQAITWVSSNPAIATVVNGVVTPISPGTAIITVTTQDGSMTATSTVTVTAKVAVTGVSLNQTALSLTAGGATNTLVATVIPTNATTQAITWVSSNPAIATVANGVVTPISPGTAIITVTTQDGSITATSTVTVAAKVAVTGINLNQTALSLTAGGATNTLVATVTPTNATTQAIIWISSNPDVATVTDGIVTPVSTGKAAIIAVTQDGSITATSTITVVPNLIDSATITTSGLLNATTDATVTSLNVYAGIDTTETALATIPVTAGSISNYKITGITQGSVYTLMPYVADVAQTSSTLAVTSQ